MQQIKFISPKGESVVIGPQNPFIFESILGIGAADTTLRIANPAALNGSVFGGLLLNDREITVNVHIHGRDRADMYQNRQKLIAQLEPANYASGQMGRLEYRNDYIHVWIPAIVKQGPQQSTRVHNYATAFQVVFYCPDPYFRAMDERTARIIYRSGGLKFPLIIDHENGVQFGERGYKAAIYNPGDAPTPIRVTITGPAQNPTLVKESTGEMIQIKKYLYENDILEINTDPHNFSVILTNAGITSDATGYIDHSTFTPIMMDPGENPIRYESDDGTTSTSITVAMHAYYGGV